MVGFDLDETKYFYGVFVTSSPSPLKVEWPEYLQYSSNGTIVYPNIRRAIYTIEDDSHTCNDRWIKFIFASLQC